MTARRALLALGGAAAALLWRAWGQGAAALPRVGVLTPAGAEILKRPESSVANLVACLRDLGHVDGRSVTLEFRFADQALDQLPALAAELVRVQPQVIYTHSNAAARAAARATGSIPIVVGPAGEEGLLELAGSLARPTGNVTGTALIRFEAAFVKLVQSHADGLVVGTGSLFNSRRERLVTLAARHKVHAICELREFAAAGGLMSYGTKLAEVYRQIGVYNGRILKGTNPADLAVIQPTRFELVINLKTAKAPGLTIPQSMLLRADEVIQ